MGACASVPKGMRAEATAAPLPEQPKEEVVTDVVEKVENEVKVEGGEEKPKEEEKVAEEKVVDDDKHQSLGSLLNENEVAKEEGPKAEKAAESSTTEKAEEPKSEAAAEKSSTETAEAPKEEKKSEEAKKN